MNKIEFFRKQNKASKPRMTNTFCGDIRKTALQAQTGSGKKAPRSRKKACLQSQKLHIRAPASLTVEAALCLPVFLFTALMLLAPLKLLDERRQLQNVMEAAAKDMAQAAYVERLMETGGKELLNKTPQPAGETGEGIFEGFAEGLNTGVTAARVLASLDGDIYRDPYFEKCNILQNDMIEMELRYDMRLPFSIFGIDSIPMSSVVNRRAWTGTEGGRGKDQYGPAEEGETSDGFDRDADGDPVVYVGKTSTVYHKDRHCHYLDNVLQRVSAETIGDRRNSSGGRYDP